MSPILDASHDRAHPVEGDGAWSESYYFNCYDPDADVGFYSRVGIRPNEGTIDVGLSLWLPGGGLAGLGAMREQKVMIDDDLVNGSVKYERLAPLKQWRITAKGDAYSHDGMVPVACEVVFDALTPAMGGDGQGKEAADGSSEQTRLSVGKGHLEQAGQWSGWIEVDGVRHTLTSEARGNRDKSWGPRRWGGPKMWRWFSINIDDDTHFGGIRIGTEAGDLHRGWVWRNGEHASIRDWDVRSTLAADGVTHTTTDLVVTDARDRRHALHGELLRVAPVAHQLGDRRTLLNEGLARWTYEGRKGHGIAEYLHQLDEAGRPLVPIE